MTLLLIALSGFLMAALGAVLPWGDEKVRSIAAGVACVGSSLAGFVGAGRALLSGAAAVHVLPWRMPFGQAVFHLDALSAFFLVPILFVGALTAWYGLGAFQRPISPSTAGSEVSSPRFDVTNAGWGWCCFALLMASMMLVVLAADGLLFLLAWEGTVLASFFLVVFKHGSAANRHAGWVYLTASHLGTAFLVVLFLVLAGRTGSFAFATFRQLAGAGDLFRGGLFLLACIGFGTKAGFFPLHVWLPEAHPAAPSHVSALMSGVMIKTGIYGLLRLLSFLGTPNAWWGWVLLLAGLASGVSGILSALAQHHLKRLLAYSSGENIGIVGMGLGIGLVGGACGSSVVAALGFAGGLLHVWNHALFKSLLFLGAGAVLEQAGSADIDVQGGLLKRMPWTGGSFLAGSIAISGLPPGNGFISEFLMYLSGLFALLSGNNTLQTAGALLLLGLPLIGGLSAACFAKAFGIIFLGEPRSRRAAEAVEAPSFKLAAMMILVAACLGVALGSPLLLNVLGRVSGVCWGAAAGGESLDSALHVAVVPLTAVVAGLVLVVLLIGGLVLLREKLGPEPVPERPVTWDCGYAAPSPTMQYTGSSFAQPLVELFSPMLRTTTRVEGLLGFFPLKASFHMHTPDVVKESLFGRLFHWVATLLHRFAWMQSGVAQHYVLYLTLTILLLLVVVLS